ncbi:tetraspanin-11-like isoform X2 [Clytia hemisphaerica]|uniref:tetraspanin-11-like isoform X2 n=1 Tax=Clytia hemisphaerica TaxID=252671 RepID=UPI0034D55F8F|eukprot:TCONS_00021598-protein
MTAKSCIKYLLFSFNVIFWLAGLAAVGVGIWLLFDPGRFNDFLGRYTFTIPASILIATGLFVCMVGFCGCAGAIKESKCLLGTYFTMLLIIFCAEIAAGVLGFLYRDKIKDEVTTEAQRVIEKEYGTGNSDIDHAVDILQEKLKCCGVKSATEYITSAWKQTTNKSYPPSCCSNQQSCAISTPDNNQLVYLDGCLDKLTEYVKDNLMILGGIGVGLACIQGKY